MVGAARTRIAFGSRTDISSASVSTALPETDTTAHVSNKLTALTIVMSNSSSIQIVQY